jgi:hypothetical protein
MSIGCVTLIPLTALHTEVVESTLTDHAHSRKERVAADDSVTAADIEHEEVAAADRVSEPAKVLSACEAASDSTLSADTVS